MESVVKNKIYINGVGCISPQPTADNNHFLDETVALQSNRLKAIEPNYKEFVPPELVRRMGRIIKMGVAAAKTCLADAGYAHSLTSEGPGVGYPDAIITGTGLGCIEDTEKFLGNMITSNEQFLTPTAFIQSTHNTVSAQIALLIRCHGYNLTYVHRGVSFESAILDSLIQMKNGRASSVLLGAVDELTNNSFRIQERMGYWRPESADCVNLFEPTMKGTVAGEGAAFFLLEEKKSAGTYAVLRDVEMLFHPTSAKEITSCIHDFLGRSQLTESEIDLLLVGRNGDVRFDDFYHEVEETAFPDTISCNFKHLCGEYMTASSFGMWLASKILKEQRLPETLDGRQKPESFRNILIYNHFKGLNHSLILLSQS